MVDHDQMLKQAIYNTGANVFVVLAGLGVVALYWVLESFFRPLIWAMLCGAFLHPFKYQVTKIIKSWLTGLKTSGTPFIFGVFKFPIDLLDSISESLINSLRRRWRVIALVIGVFLFLYVTYHHAPMDFKQLLGYAVRLYVAASGFVNFFSFKWVCALVVCYIIAVIGLWSPENKHILGYLAMPVWIITMLCLIANSGTLRLPLTGAVVLLVAMGYSDAWSNGNHSTEANNNTHSALEVNTAGDDEQPPGGYTVFSPTEVSFIESLPRMFASYIETATVSHDISNQPIKEEEEIVEEMADTCKLETAKNPGKSHVNQQAETIESDKVSGDEEDKEKCAEDTHVEDASPSSHTRSDFVRPNEIGDKETPKAKKISSTPFRMKKNSIKHILSVSKIKIRRNSDKYFIFLFWAFMLVMLWSNVWLILLPLISFVFRLLKYAIEWVQWFVTSGYQEVASQELESVRVWCEQRLEVLLPTPFRGVISMLLKGDNRVIDILLGSADTIISITLILLLLVSFVLVSVGVCFQVQKEGIHLVTVTSNLVQNSTVQPQWFTDIFRNGTVNETTGIHSSLDPMIKNVYTFGREWIVKKLSEAVSHRPSRELVQNELVGIWDSLYESWVTKNTTRIAKPNYNGALFSQLKEDGVYFFWQMSTVDISGIFKFVKENIGIFQSVVESVWILVRGNVNLAFTLLISFLQIILGGSTAILNSIVSLIVFFTTLFYLLSSSCEDYKPVELISKLTIAKTGSKFAQAVEDGIGGVFAATLKMATFYGIYTWLTHTVFGINIVFLPSVFAALLGAIPFVGTYWAAVPAVLELSLIHKEIFLATLLAICHVLPTFVVDTALYSDIRGGGHPYLTGLAIAGGVYCFGLQGAIMGPVLLCCIIVAMNLYSAMITDYPITPMQAAPGSQVLQGRRNLFRSASTNL